MLFLHDLPSLSNLQFEAELDPEPLPDPELEPEDADDDELGQLGPLVSDTAELAELDAD